MGGADPAQAREWCQAFGERVRECRAARGLSQMALAESAGLHPTYVSGIERGLRNVSLANIHLLASALNVPISDFFE